MTTESTETWQLTIDTQKPVVPVIAFIGSNSQTGKISEIRGMGENGTTLALYDKDNNPITGTTSWDGSGTFTFTPATPLDPGSSLYVKSRDSAAHVSQSSTGVVGFSYVKDVFKDIAVYHGTVQGNSVRLEKNTSYEFHIAVNGAAPVTVKAYIQYNTANGAAARPKIALSGPGILGTETGQYAVATGVAENAWEQLTVTGTPNAKGVVTLKVETFSTAEGAKAWVDDSTVSQ